MTMMNKRTLEFKKKFCDKCNQADKRELRMGRTKYCAYIIEHKREPEFRNGHCTEFKPIKPKKKKKESGKNDG